MNILTINAGSSSIKYKAFQVHEQQVLPLLAGLIEGIGETQGQWHHQQLNKVTEQHAFKTHAEAFGALAAKLQHALANYPLQAIGHRVVHGGEHYFEPTLIRPKVLNAIRELAQLAPIHNPINALGIEYAQQYFPQAQHIAIFDSGFHHSLPPKVHQYPLHVATAEQYQIKRYGFHGINHEYVAQQAATFINKPLAQCELISLHLGNGASACLIKQGQSYDTSMGLTPLAGLVMGTRCGDIDPAIPLYLQRQGMSLDDVDTLLNKHSGLKGIAGENDMRQLISKAAEGDAAANLAIDMYVYAIQKTIGAYLSQLPNLDALIFTGGVGENAALIREKIIAPLQHLGLVLDPTANTKLTEANCQTISSGKLAVLVIRGDEEACIAQKTYQCLKNGL